MVRIVSGGSLSAGQSIVKVGDGQRVRVLFLQSSKNDSGFPVACEIALYRASFAANRPAKRSALFRGTARQ